MFEKMKKIILEDGHYLKVLHRLDQLLIEEGVAQGASFVFIRNGKEFLVSECGSLDQPYCTSYELTLDSGRKLGEWMVCSERELNRQEKGLLQIAADLLGETLFFEEWEYDSSYTQNRGCQYFPCHEMPDERDFNCLFCYCPLYFIVDCGGDFSILESGIKDCSNCRIPHQRDNYEYILGKLGENM